MTMGEHIGSPVAVIGLGLMGRSIAACLLAAGHRVVGVTDNLDASAGTPERIRVLLVEMAEEGLLTEPAQAAMERFHMTAELRDIAGAEIVFESVTEDLKVKRELLHRSEQFVGPDCILATNTSALPVSHLQEGAIYPERILGLHWDEPAHITRFMEIIPGKSTAPRYLDRVAKLALTWGKNHPSCVRKYAASSPTVSPTQCSARRATRWMQGCAASKTWIARCATMLAGGFPSRVRSVIWT